MPRRRERTIQNPKFGFGLRYGTSCELHRADVFATKEAALKAAGDSLAAFSRYNGTTMAFVFEILGTVKLPDVPPEFTPIKK